MVPDAITYYTIVNKVRILNLSLCSYTKKWDIFDNVGVNKFLSTNKKVIKILIVKTFYVHNN